MKPCLYVPAALLFAVLPCFAKTKIACVGDSITFGATVAQRATHSYPYCLQQMLGEDYEVVNFGNSGKTAGDYPGQKRRGRYYGDTKEHQNAVSFEGDMYICNLGINDTGPWWDAKLFVQGYEDLIGQWIAKRKNTKLFMWTQLAPDFRGPLGQKACPGNVFDPKYHFPLSDNGTAVKRPEVEKLLGQIASKHKAVEMDMLTPLDNHPEFYSGDGLHPNASGAKRLAQLTCAALYREQPWKQASPSIDTDAKAQTITLANASKQAIVLDAGALAVHAGEKKKTVFRFGDGSALGPGESVTIRFHAEANANDFGGEMTTKSPLRGSVRYISAPAKREARQKWEIAAQKWAGK